MFHENDTKQSDTRQNAFYWMTLIHDDMPVLCDSSYPRKVKPLSLLLEVLPKTYTNNVHRSKE
jgi:hypothetical protein